VALTNFFGIRLRVATANRPDTLRQHSDSRIESTCTRFHRGNETLWNSLGTLNRNMFQLWNKLDELLSCFQTVGGSVWESKGQASKLRLVLSRRCSCPFSPTGTNGTRLHGTGVTIQRNPVRCILAPTPIRGFRRRIHTWTVSSVNQACGLHPSSP
jgi:hypothetical protein